MLYPDTIENFTYMNFDFSKQKDKKIQIHEKCKTNLIAVESVTYLECDGYVTTVYSIDNKPITISKLLKHFEKELNQFGGFVRVNRKTLVNTRHISCIRKIGVKKIIEINGCSIEISHRKSFLFKIT